MPDCGLRIAHRLVVKARRFRALSWPTQTSTYEKNGTCRNAEEMAAMLRASGAKVLLMHIDHRPPGAPEFDPE